MTTDNGSPENIEEELRSLKGIVSIAQVVVSSLELDEVLQNILYSAMATMGMPAGSIALFEEKFSELSARPRRPQPQFRLPSEVEGQGGGADSPHPRGGGAVRCRRHRRCRLLQ
jgi:hypothetical protein